MASRFSAWRISCSTASGAALSRCIESCGRRTDRLSAPTGKAGGKRCSHATSNTGFAGEPLSHDRPRVRCRLPLDQSAKGPTPLSDKPVDPSDLRKAQICRCAHRDIVLQVRPSKRLEVLSAIGQVMRGMRMTPECVVCRSFTAAEDANTSCCLEWSTRVALEDLLKSEEFLVLRGMRMLLQKRHTTGGGRGRRTNRPGSRRLNTMPATLRVTIVFLTLLLPAHPFAIHAFAQGETDPPPTECDSPSCKRERERLEREKPSKSSFFDRVHLDVLGAPPQIGGGSNLVGLVGAHLTIAEFGRIYLFGPPGVMVAVHAAEDGRSGRWRPMTALNWGISVRLIEFRGSRRQSPNGDVPEPDKDVDVGRFQPRDRFCRSVLRLEAR